jgi:hypothetical protein
LRKPQVTAAVLFIGLLLVAFGCSSQPNPDSPGGQVTPRVTAAISWDPDFLTIERQVEISDVIVVGTIIKVDDTRWNSPDGKEWSPPEEESLPIVYETFYLEPTTVLKGTPRWGTPIAFRMTYNSLDGVASFSAGENVVAFGSAGQRYGPGGVYQPADAYWLTLENNSLWLEQAGVYRNQGHTKDPAEATMSLEALEGIVAGSLQADTSTTRTTSDNVATTYPALALPEEMPADFGFVAAYGVRAKNVIDTFAGTYIKDLGSREDPVTTGLRLAPEELETLYRDIVEMQTSRMLFTIAPLAIDPDPQRTGTTMMVTPYISYRLEWRIGDFRYNPVVWDDTSWSTDPKAVALRDWFKKLQQMIEAKPEWKALPPMQGGYA